MTRNDILERKEDILQWISENQSKAFICRQLKCKPETLNSYLAKMGIDYKGNKGLKGFSHDEQYKPAEQYIKNEYVSSHRLKEKLIKEGIKQARCELCLLAEWQGQPIPLELHHKDGNHYNNNFDNLMILCPSCHALQKNDSKSIKSNESQNHCIDCGINISKSAIRCKSCAGKIRNQNSIKHSVTREELKKLIRTTSFLQIGRKFGVSDNAIRKWCDSYNLPRTKMDINAYSDEEWENI